MRNTVSNQLIRATMTRLEADRQEALATIELYLNSSVGVADHSGIVNELTSAANRLATAEESLETLNRNFLRNTTSEDDEENE